MNRFLLKKSSQVIPGEQGFTLAEILVAMTIFGILVSMAVPLYINTTANSEKDQLKAEVMARANSIQAARINSGNVFSDQLPNTNSSSQQGIIFKYSVQPNRDDFCLSATKGNLTLYMTKNQTVPAESPSCDYSSTLLKPFLSAQIDDSGVVKLSWSFASNSPTVKYDLYRDGNLVATLNSTSDNWTDPQKVVKLKTTVGYTLTASDSARGVAAVTSNLASVYRPGERPAAPLNATADLTSSTPLSNSYRVWWDAVPKATRYDIYDADNSMFIASTTDSFWNASVPRQNVKKIQVRAFNDQGGAPLPHQL